MSTHVPRPPKTELSACFAAGAEAAPIVQRTTTRSPLTASLSTPQLYGRLMEDDVKAVLERVDVDTDM